MRFHHLGPLVVARHAVVSLLEAHDLDPTIKEAIDQEGRFGGNRWRRN